MNALDSVTHEWSELGERERSVLQSLVGAYVATAEPVASRTVSRRYLLDVSPATIRNTMVDLEEMGYLWQPHTSAGRIPTDKGYRFYVDSLMGQLGLTPAEKRALERKLQASIRERDIQDVLQQVAKVIASVSEQLGIVLSPLFDMGVFRRLDLVQVTERKILMAVTVESGLVRTIVFEAKSKVRPSKLAETCQLVNERLSGLLVGEIRRSMAERLRWVSRGDPKLIRFLVEQADTLFRFDFADDLHLVGTTNIFSQPEFSDRDRVTHFLELLEDREGIVCLLASRAREGGVRITIGSENPSEHMRDCSLVTSVYEIGNVRGLIGVLGPTRMRYSRVASLVDYAAQLTGSLLEA